MLGDAVSAMLPASLQRVTVIYRLNILIQDVYRFTVKKNGRLHLGVMKHKTGEIDGVRCISSL